jgi:hypothetical protein
VVQEIVLHKLHRKEIMVDKEKLMQAHTVMAVVVVGLLKLVA